MKDYKYYEVRYNKDDDAFETWVAVTEGHEPNDDDFGLEFSYKCVNSVYDSPELIHFSILKCIARAYDLGYKVIWRI